MTGFEIISFVRGCIVGVVLTALLMLVTDKILTTFPGVRLGKKKGKKEDIVLSSLYSNMFWVYPEDVEDFLVWALRNHDAYGRFLTIEEWAERGEDGARKLCVSCYGNNEALVAAEIAAGYPFAMVDWYSGVEGDSDFRILRERVDSLPAEDKKHVALVAGSDGLFVYLCVDHGRQDILQTLDIEGLGAREDNIIQEGEMR